MSESHVTVQQFRSLLGIERDENWLGGESEYSMPPYRIVAGREVRAIPLGLIVDNHSDAVIQPLKRDHGYFSGIDRALPEWDELRPCCDDPDTVLLTFPASRKSVIQFIDRADLDWLVDTEQWSELGLDDVDEDESYTDADADRDTDEAKQNASERMRQLGREGGKARGKALERRNAEIREEAMKLQDRGNQSWATILADRHEMTPTNIRRICKKTNT